MKQCVALLRYSWKYSRGNFPTEQYPSLEMLSCSHVSSSPHFFLWCHLKIKVYKNNVTSLDELKLNMKDEIMAVAVGTLRAVMQSMVNRKQKCLDVDGHDLKEIFYKDLA